MSCVVMLKPNRFTEPLCWNYNILDIIAQNGFIIPLLPFIQFWKKWRQFTIFLLHCCQGIFCQNTKILVFVWGQLSNRKMDSWNLKARLLFPSHWLWSSNKSLFFLHHANMKQRRVPFMFTIYIIGKTWLHFKNIFLFRQNTYLIFICVDFRFC